MRRRPSLPKSTILKALALQNRAAIPGRQRPGIRVFRQNISCPQSTQLVFQGKPPRDSEKALSCTREGHSCFKASNIVISGTKTPRILASRTTSPAFGLLGLWPFTDSPTTPAPACPKARYLPCPKTQIPHPAARLLPYFTMLQCQPQRKTSHHCPTSSSMATAARSERSQTAQLANLPAWPTHGPGIPADSLSQCSAAALLGSTHAASARAHARSLAQQAPCLPYLTILPPTGCRTDTSRAPAPAAVHRQPTDPMSAASITAAAAAPGGRGVNGS